MTTTINYHDLKNFKTGGENINEAINQGYTHYAWYVNSDESWLFFSKNIEDAESKAIELVIDQKGCARETAEEFWSENVNVGELKELLA